MNIEIYTGGILVEIAARHGYMPRLLARSTKHDGSHYEETNAHEDANSASVPRVTRQYMGQGLYPSLTSTSTPM